LLVDGAMPVEEDDGAKGILTGDGIVPTDDDVDLEN